MTRSWRRILTFAKGCGLEGGGSTLSAVLGEIDHFAGLVDGLGEAGSHDLRLACDELVANVIRHAAGEADAVVHIELAADGDSVLLRIRDNGPAFDPFSQADPYLGSDVRGRRVGGVGLYLVRTLFPLGKWVREDGWNVSEVRYCFGEDGAARMGRRSPASPR